MRTPRHDPPVPPRPRRRRTGGVSLQRMRRPASRRSNQSAHRRRARTERLRPIRPRRRAALADGFASDRSSERDIGLVSGVGCRRCSSRVWIGNAQTGEECRVPELPSPRRPHRFRGRILADEARRGWSNVTGGPARGLSLRLRFPRADREGQHDVAQMWGSRVAGAGKERTLVGTAFLARNCPFNAFDSRVVGEERHGDRPLRPCGERGESAAITTSAAFTRPTASASGKAAVQASSSISTSITGPSSLCLAAPAWRRRRRRP